MIKFCFKILTQDTHSVNPAEKQWAARISKNLSWDDEEDEEIAGSHAERMVQVRRNFDS